MTSLQAIFFDIDDTLFPTTEFARRARRNAVRAMVEAGLDVPEDQVYRELTEVIGEFTSNYERHYDHLLKRLGPLATKSFNPGLVVAAGVVAEAVLRTVAPIEIVGWVDRVGEIGSSVDPETVTREGVDTFPVRCPDPKAAETMSERIVAAREAGDSLGGWVRVVARGVPAGWGDPIYGKLKALLAHGLLSLPAAVAFESGDGIASTYRTGTENNDQRNGAPSTRTLDLFEG